MSYIRSIDAALYYEEYGSGETLILLPDFLGTIESDWRRFLPEFAGHFHVVAADLRGHGKTNNPSGTLRVDSLCADLDTLFETLEIDAAFLCTHGIISSLAVIYAIRHPERIRGIILHAPELVSPEHPRSPSAPDAPTGEYLSRLHEPANGPDGWTGLVRAHGDLLQDIASSFPDEVRASFMVPVLLTSGEEEPPLHGSRAGMFPRASTVRVPQSGGTLSAVQKQPFVGAVVSFARRIADQR